MNYTECLRQEIAAMSEAYLERGFEIDADPIKTRRAYLRSLAEDYCIPLGIVNELAETLGPSEDFDGLVSELQDLADSGYFED